MVLSPWWQEGCLARLLRKDVTSVTTLSLHQCLPHMYSFIQIVTISFKKICSYKYHDYQRGINQCSGERRQSLPKGYTTSGRSGQPERTRSASTRGVTHRVVFVTQKKEVDGGGKSAQIHWKTGFCSSSVSAS